MQWSAVIVIRRFTGTAVNISIDAGSVRNVIGCIGRLNQIIVFYDLRVLQRTVIWEWVN